MVAYMDQLTMLDPDGRLTEAAQLRRLVEAETAEREQEREAERERQATEARHGRWSRQHGN
jgi:hypothetical protein